VNNTIILILSVVADQSIHGMMGLVTACKEETLRMNISVVSSGGRKLYLSFEENCVPAEIILRGHLPRGTEEKYEVPQSGMGPKFELDISQMYIID
jgi:hypothetical protein